MHTPVSIYLKVRDMYPQSALMESSDYHAGENSLSFIALCPLASIGINGGIVTSNYPDNSRTEEPLTKTFHVEKAMNRFINQFQVTGDNKNVCGLYGYTTFNAVKYFEHIPVKENICILELVSQCQSYTSRVCFHRGGLGFEEWLRIISRKHIRERINIFLMRTEYTSQVHIEVRGKAITYTYRIIHDPFIDRIIRNRTNRKDLFLSILQFILDRTIAVGDTCSYGKLRSNLYLRTYTDRIH